jgi:hypothetical protein
MAEKESAIPVKLAELHVLSAKYQIALNIRGMGSYKEVNVSRGRMKQYQWRKLILRLKAAGFEYIEGQGQWFGTLNKSGKKWQTGPYRDILIPA